MRRLHYVEQLNSSPVIRNSLKCEGYHSFKHNIEKKSYRYHTPRTMNQGLRHTFNTSLQYGKPSLESNTTVHRVMTLVHFSESTHSVQCQLRTADISPVSTELGQELVSPGTEPASEEGDAQAGEGRVTVKSGHSSRCFMRLSCEDREMDEGLGVHLPFNSCWAVRPPPRMRVRK